MNKYKAIAFDMDGTLLNSKQEIHSQTIEVLSQLKAKNIKIVLVTGRHHSVIYPYYQQLKLDTNTICCNGSYIYDFKNQHILNPNPLLKNHAIELLEMVKNHHIHTLIYNEDSIYYEIFDDHLQKLTNWINSLPENIQPKLKQINDFNDVINSSKYIFKFATSSHDIKALKSFSQEVESKGLFECEWSWINRADVALKGNSKGNGLVNWAKQENIDMSEIIAFGDNFNDLSMIKSVGLGVAMGNSDEEIKQQADLVIGDHNSNTIAETLIKLFSMN